MNALRVASEVPEDAFIDAFRACLGTVADPYASCPVGRGFASAGTRASLGAEFGDLDSPEAGEGVLGLMAEATAAKPGAGYIRLCLECDRFRRRDPCCPLHRLHAAHVA
jgi:hypothetical protein